MKRLPARTPAVVAAMLIAAGAMAAPSLDFEFYRTRVEPIFAKKRPEHARCIVCHMGNRRPFHLEPLASGATAWTVEQSRRNFETVSSLIVPGAPEKSPFLLHPLAGSAGGDPFHSGGRQFRSKDDPDWKTIADWVRQAK